MLSGEEVRAVLWGTDRGQIGGDDNLRSLCAASHFLNNRTSPHKPLLHQPRGTMKQHAVVVVAVSLACSVSSTAFVHPTTAAGTRATTNSPRLGDASFAIPPPSRGRSRQQQQWRHNHKEHRYLGRGRHLTATLGGNTSLTLVSAVVPSISVLLTWVPSAVGAVVAVLTAASVVNALQAGVRGDLGLTQEKILGVPTEEATPEHVAKLGARIDAAFVARLNFFDSTLTDTCLSVPADLEVPASSLELLTSSAGTCTAAQQRAPTWVGGAIQVRCFR